VHLGRAPPVQILLVRLYLHLQSDPICPFPAKKAHPELNPRITRSEAVHPLLTYYRRSNQLIHIKNTSNTAIGKLLPWIFRGFPPCGKPPAPGTIVTAFLQNVA
jgi:hypothetical protein